MGQLGREWRMQQAYGLNVYIGLAVSFWDFRCACDGGFFNIFTVILEFEPYPSGC